MIRFVPDNWQEALLRPLAMTAPDAGVYVETMAPDFRFMIALALAPAVVMLLLLRRRRPSVNPRAAVVLFAVTAWAFVPWLGTTGNGRYFMPFLMAIGPLCLVLVHLLPATRAFRVVAALCIVGVQGFAVHQSDSVRQWGLAPWQQSYFRIDVPPEMAAQPGTYVTLPSVSFSLIAPQFHPASTWLSTAWLTTDRTQTDVGRRAHALLSQPDPVLLVPSMPEHATARGLPDDIALRGINNFLEEHQLAVDEPERCRLLPSETVALLPAYRQARAGGFTGVAGFWACPLRYPVASSRPKIRQSKFDSVFEKVETLCPRFFRATEAPTQVIRNGEMRQYSESDMRVYVMDDGLVFYSYRRTINPVKIGSIAEVLGGAAVVDCSRIRGRSGLPWEREL